MSASREKKKRQEMLAGGGDPRAAREAEKKAAERKTNILYGVGAAVFVVLAVFLLVYNSGVIQRNQTAVTLDGEKYTVSQLNYYYQQICSSYASMFGTDYLPTLKKQTYNGDRTWDDYFKESAVDNLKLVHAAVRGAEAAGVALDSGDEETLSSNVNSMKEAAKSAGYSYGAYLKAVYGPTMTASVYESCLRDQILASKYDDYYSEEHFVYTDEEIQAYYEEHKDTYDIIDGEYVTFSGTPEAKTDADGNAVEATEEEKAAAMEAAKAQAEAMLASVKAGANLEMQAEAAGLTYSGTVSGSGTEYGKWFYDEARRAGDAEVIEDEASNCYYVAVFNGRSRDDSPATYDVRHILVTAANVGLPEGETATDEQIKAKAEEILAGWDGTEDGFAALANANSQDGGSNANGGLYEDVPQGQMVAAFEDWCYEDGRKPGDTGIVSSTHGYHIMYFVGYGDTEYWHYACENAMENEARTEWQTSLVDSVAGEVNAGAMKNIK